MTESKVERELRLHRRMVFPANDLLSRLASGVRREQEGLAVAHEDIALWHAPSECGKLVERSFRRRMTDLFKRAMMHPHAYNHEVIIRVGNKVAWRHELLVHPADVDPGVYSPWDMDLPPFLTETFLDWWDNFVSEGGDQCQTP